MLADVTGTADHGAPGAPPWTDGAAWIDGRYCPIADAKISVLDRRDPLGLHL